jgi:hypothetical protein
MIGGGYEWRPGAIVFADRGTHGLKGVPDGWRLYALA